jgi:hypothetical protein
VVVADDRGAPRVWLTRSAILAFLALAALTFGLLTALAGGDRTADEDDAAINAAPSADDGAAAPTAGLWSGKGFRIARVRPGSRIGLHARPGGRLISRVGDRTEFGSRRAFSIRSRRGTWLEVLSEEIAHDRTAWIRADPERLRFRTTPWSIRASLAEREVELRRHGEVTHRFEVTIGAEATATPTGRFAVTDVIVGGLNPVYGCCAIAFTARQDELPEGWIGGDRVALHGTSGPLGQASSNGCLRARNGDLRTLIDVIPLGAPVFIA